MTGVFRIGLVGMIKNNLVFQRAFALTGNLRFNLNSFGGEAAKRV